jgi:hypothetical protein
MDRDGRISVRLEMTQQAKQMVNVAVNAPIGQETDQVETGTRTAVQLGEYRLHWGVALE